MGQLYVAEPLNPPQMSYNNVQHNSNSGNSGNLDDDYHFLNKSFEVLSFSFFLAVSRAQQIALETFLVMIFFLFYI